MTGAPGVVALAAAWLWWGLVVAISLLEAPLKFRAPGVTLALALGIGRLVFRALNLVEVVVAALLVAVAAVGGASAPAAVLLGVLVALLGTQVGVLRPRLDRRTARILAGEQPAPSRLHLCYLALEGIKVIALPTLGVVVAASLIAAGPR